MKCAETYEDYGIVQYGPYKGQQFWNRIDNPRNFPGWRLVALKDSEGDVAERDIKEEMLGYKARNP